MKRGMVKNLATGAAILALSILAAVGCSDQSTPLAPNSNQSVNPLVGRAGSSGSTEIYGLVTSVDPSTRIMTINSSSLTIEVLSTAEVVSRNSGVETPITLSEIHIGDSAEVRGDSAAGNVLLADRVRIEIEDNNPNEVEISGRIAIVDAAARTITLQNNATLINVAANAEVVQKVSGMETPIELSDLSPGDSLDVRGDMQTDGSLLADRVRLRMSDDNDDFVADTEFKSTITSIDYTAGTLTVASRTETITTDANTFIYMSDDIAGDDGHGNTPAGKMGPGSDDDGPDGHRTRMAIQFTDLVVGDTIEVHANVVDANTLYAVAIELEDGAFEANLEVEFKGVIATLDLGTRTVTFNNSSLTGVVVDNADLQNLADMPIGLDGFSVGTLVEVKGFKTGDQTFDIVRMHMDNN